MACTYSTVEIQREPEFRVFKKCMFYNLPCAEVRGSGKCALLKRTAAAPVIAGVAQPQGDYKEALNEELRRFDNIPATGGEFKTIEKGKETTPKPSGTATTSPQSDVDLLKAELSDFMDKIESKKEKATIPKKKTD
jgi:hypothetical protein